MAVGPEFEKKTIDEVPPQSQPAALEGNALGQFGEGLRHLAVHQMDGVSFEAVNGHEEWHQSLRYPQ